jgi:hypothetical protein
MIFTRFRWVDLQIQNLCDSTRMKLQEDIEKELGKLPKTLKESYNAIYERISGSGPVSWPVARRAMDWLLCARRPLHTSEFVAAVSVDPEGKCVRLSNKDLLNICCNMLVLDSELDVFRFAHLSVQEYLQGLHNNSVDNANAVVVDRCLQVYLNDQQIEHASVGQHNLLRSYATLYWTVHYQSLDSQQRRKSLKTSVNNFLFQGSRVSSCFTKWARAVSQACGVLGWDDPLKDRLRAVPSSPLTPLITACIFGFSEILEELDIEKTNWNQWNDDGQSALSLAARYGHEAVVRLLLDTGKVDVDSTDKKDGRTPLSWAAECGHEAVVRLLLDTGKVDVDSTDKDGRTPLSWAAQNEHEAVVKLLKLTTKSQ